MVKIQNSIGPNVSRSVSYTARMKALLCSVTRYAISSVSQKRVHQ